jgi:membrane-associated phospholipid phosphatase
VTWALLQPLARVTGHIRRLWPGAGILLPLPFAAWAIGCLLAGRARSEHILFLVGVPLLAYVNRTTKDLFVGLLPIGLLGLVYDAMRWVKDVGVTPDRVHLCDLRAIDMHIASVTVAGEPGTVHDWVQAHPSLPLDVACAVPYGTFIFFVIGFAIWLYAKDYARMRVFGWVLLLVNLAGFTTYHLYPAAPPWYFHAHGCTVDLAARSSEGVNLARVDAFLGVHYFRDFYGRASDVFGAVPSLHASYPMLVVLFGWPVLKWPGRAFTIGFASAMCVAAVYLDHHWIIDVVLGLGYAVAISAAAVLVVRAWSSRRDFASAATPEITRETVP